VTTGARAITGKSAPFEADWLPLILDHVQATAYARDREGRLVFVNRQCEVVLGLPRAEMLGKTNAELFPSDAPTLNTNDERIWATGQAEELVEHLVVDGEQRTFASTKFPLRDREGAIVAVAGISVDITDRTRADAGLRRERELTQRIVDSVGDGILAFDTECRYTVWNPEMERISGMPASAVVGKLAFEVFPFLVDTGEDRCFREALAGRKCNSKEQRFEVPESGRSGIFEGEYSPLHDANDNVVGGIAIIRDITQRKVEEENRLRVARIEAAHAAAEGAARRFAFLAKAGEVLASSLDYEHTLRTIAKLAIHELGDACMVDVVEDGKLRRVGIAHATPEKAQLLEELRVRFPATASSPSPAGRVLRDQKPELLSVVDLDVIVAHCVSGEHVDLIRRINMRSHLAVPLIVRNNLVGVISLAVTESDRRYDEADLALATDLARRAALAIDNALLYRAAQLSEQRIRAVFEQSPLSAQLLATDGAPLRVNAAWEKLAAANVVNDPELLRRAAAGESVQTPEIRYEGSPPFWLRAFAYPIKDADGAVHEVVFVHEDVSAQMTASERVRASEERLRIALQSARMCVWEVDIATNRVECSENARELYGIDAGSPADFIAVIHPDDRATTLSERVNHDDTYHAEYRVRIGGNQEERWLQSHGRLERDASGNRLRIRGVSIDITDRKAAEIATAVLADAGRTLNQSLDATATLHDLANLVVPRLADWCAVDLVDEQGLIEPLVAALGSKSPTRRMMETREPLWLREVSPNDGFAAGSLICVPLIARGEVLGSITLARACESGRRYEASDVAVAAILARRAASAVENARLYERLREEDRRKDEFLATLAHELRNPLAPVRTGLDLLAAKSDPTTEAVRAIMERQLHHMTRLIDDLLDVSRVSRGKIDLHREPLDVAQLVRSALEVSSPALEAARLRVEIKLPAAPMIVDGDRTRLAQVFSNLLNNAAKFTPAGGAVTIEVSRTAAEAEVRLADTGIGIERALLSQVFEMFVQAPGHQSRAQGGLGIGLTLVRRLIDLHGGRVWAESEGSNRGSVFIVRLPLAGGGESERSVVATSTTRAPTTPRRVLVVDDNIDAARMLVLLLEMDHHVVRRAASGPEALHVIKEFKPEIALLDIGLPGMSGLELARILRADESLKGIVLVAVTGWGQEEDRRRSREAGFDHHLTKPMEASELAAVIDGMGR
jgi:PAS domain S-box-containing protein